MVTIRRLNPSSWFYSDCQKYVVVRLFHRQGFALNVAQPWPDRRDESARELFKLQIKALYGRPEVDIWFSDESGFEGDPRPRQRWDRIGHKIRVTKNGDHLRMKVLGMICPRNGEFFAIEAYVCKAIDQLLDRLDQAILDVINHPEQTQKTAAIGTLF